LLPSRCRSAARPLRACYLLRARGARTHFSCAGTAFPLRPNFFPLRPNCFPAAPELLSRRARTSWLRPNPFYDDSFTLLPLLRFAGGFRCAPAAFPLPSSCSPAARPAVVSDRFRCAPYAPEPTARPLPFPLRARCARTHCAPAAPEPSARPLRPRCRAAAAQLPCRVVFDDSFTFLTHPLRARCPRTHFWTTVSYF